MKEFEKGNPNDGCLTSAPGRGTIHCIGATARARGCRKLTAVRMVPCSWGGPAFCPTCSLQYLGGETWGPGDRMLLQRKWAAASGTGSPPGYPT